jgi:hypothetical protein
LIGLKSSGYFICTESENRRRSQGVGAVVIRLFSLNEAPLGLFKLISDYLPYFELINTFFNIITKKFELIYKD